MSVSTGVPPEPVGVVIRPGQPARAVRWISGPSGSRFPKTVLRTALRTVGISDTTDDPDKAGRRLLDEVRTGGLRDRMRSHLAAHESPVDLNSFRRTVASGDSLSEVVDEGRDERG